MKESRVIMKDKGVPLSDRVEREGKPSAVFLIQSLLF